MAKRRSIKGSGFFNSGSFLGGTVASRGKERRVADEIWMIDDHIKRAPAKPFMGDISGKWDPTTGKRVSTVGEAHLKATAADIRDRINRGEGFPPIGYETHPVTGEQTLLYEDAAWEAMRLGYICPNCKQPQENPASLECQIRGKAYGCNHKRGLDGW